jgi:Tfp pilus assembly protein PilO
MKPGLPSKVDLSGVKNAVINFIVPLICLGISAALGLLVIYPSFNSIAPLKDEIDTQQNLKTNLETKVTRLKDLQSYRSVVKENAELVNKVFVSEASAPLFLDQVNQLALNASFDVTRLATSSAESDTTTTPQPNAKTASAPTNEIKSLTAALGAKASYEDLIRFLKDQEAASRILDIKDFRYNFRSESEGEGGTVEISVSGPYMLVESTAVTDEAIDLDVKSRTFTDLIALLKKLKHYDFSGTFTPPAKVVEPLTENQPADQQTTTTTNPAGEATGQTTPPTVQGAKDAKNVKEDVKGAKTVKNTEKD